MPTAACGINCDVCKLKLLDICSSRGGGTSLEGERKYKAQKSGGIATEGGDVGFRFLALPKVPLYFHPWLADRDFPAKVSVHFDKSIESHLLADAICGGVNLRSETLLKNG